MPNPDLAAQSIESMPMAEAAPEEPRIGLTARIGGALRNGYDYLADHAEAIRDKATTLVALGSIAFVGAQAAELFLTTDSVAAEGNTPTATASSMRQYCGRTMSHLFPKFVDKIPSTNYWGTFLELGDNNKQTFGITIDTRAEPQKCIDAGYQLRGTAAGYIGQPDNRSPYRVTTLSYGGSAKEKKRVASVPFTVGYKKVTYQCTEGPAKTPVFVETENKVVDRSGHVLEAKERRHTVTVLRGYRPASC